MQAFQSVTRMFACVLIAAQSLKFGGSRENAKADVQLKFQTRDLITTFWRT